MPPKQKTPAPIDRPLSRAYLREFSGWSTEFPPGLSEPTSLRQLENMLVNRDGSLRVRPGLRYLSYAQAPSTPPPPDTTPAAYATVWEGSLIAEGDVADYSLTPPTGEIDLPFGQAFPLVAGTEPAWNALDDVVPYATAGWLYRTLDREMTLKLRVDGDVRVYLDGVLVHTSIGGAASFPNVTQSLDVGPGELAIWCKRHVRAGGDGHYYDFALESTEDYVAPEELPGLAPEVDFVGTFEPFYLNDGTKAYLQAVREVDESVGFRVMVIDTNGSALYGLTDDIVDFDVPQGESVLNFSSETTYVKYLQIDNKIFAMSDAGETLRIFYVGEHKEAKALASIARPAWDNEDKLSVVHPEAAWIDAGEEVGTRKNMLPNPSFEKNLKYWNEGNDDTEMTRVKSHAESGDRSMRLRSKPQRTNLATHPLHDVATYGTAGWSEVYGTKSESGAWMQVDTPVGPGLAMVKSRLLTGIEGGKKYQVAYDTNSDEVDAYCIVRFYGVNDAQLGKDQILSVPNGNTRFVSDEMLAPKDAVSARIFPAGSRLGLVPGWIRVKDVVLCRANESTNLFTGSSGANYFWEGDAGASISTYHPPADVFVRTDPVPIRPGKACVASVYIEAGDDVRNLSISLLMLNKHGVQQDVETTALAPDTAGAPTRFEAGVAATPSNATQGELWISIPSVPRGESHFVDAAMIEPKASVAGDYFDGSTPDVPTNHQEWLGDKHASASKQIEYVVANEIPTAETKTVDTLISSTGSDNDYSFGFFYTFENEVGESAASKITVKRAQRAWADWKWELPNAAGEPNGNDTDVANRCADQLVAIMPEEVWDEALENGAIQWNLYMFTWSNQDPVPVVAQKVAVREIRDESTYDTAGWQRVTPANAETDDLMALPSKENRVNYSTPAAAAQGLVAADRMILVNDPTAGGVIKWSSSQLGEYTNFTATKGGGFKTLTSGNLFIPAVVKLWQNPQSADTLWIGCLGTDGYSASYYMTPAQVASQSDAVNVMGFEETTATPGTSSPFGVEVFNNSLYHPLDDQLMKSTASNYNINHKSLTDNIKAKWEQLADKYWIISGEHDGRLYYLVHNPEGTQLQEGMKGNEVWVYDAMSKSGSWSRYLIQAHSLRKLEFGGQIYMSVSRPDGIYYLDPAYSVDDVVEEDFTVTTAGVPWFCETNTQGANRAHDAWAHLRQVTLTLGNFLGAAEWGVIGYDQHGKVIDISKVVRDRADLVDALPFDRDDHLQVRREMKEWRFWARSLTEDDVVVPTQGQVSLVQYRYTPVSVNVGYEYGSVETFEYGRDAVGASSTVTDGGIPQPMMDLQRP